MNDTGVRRHASVVRNLRMPLVLLGSALLVAVIGCTGADARNEPSGEKTRVPRLRLAARPDQTRLDSAYAEAARLPRLHSLIVQWRGTVLRERYFNGVGPERPANIKSASKSILSALVGIAIAEGRIAGLHATLGELLPVETRDLDSAKRAITVGDLLTMRSGLQSTSFAGYGRWVASRNWVRGVLQQPVIAPRGEGAPMLYSTGSTHLLSAILTRATRMSTYEYARRRLAQPMGIALRPWPRDPQGIFFGGNDMYLRPGDMLKIGTLYLNGGRWAGKQVVPAAWIDSSLVPRTTSRWNGNGYGYGWWTRRPHGLDVHYAWGYGGQFIFIVPALELVVVSTSSADVAREERNTWAVQRLVEQGILPAFLELGSVDGGSRTDS
jgi:CubicO group peptidase (beta-lactamase class C family)